MKRILLALIISLFALPASATVPYWQVISNPLTGDATAYLSGLLKIYPSTTTAAASPAFILDGVTPIFSIRSGADVSTITPTGFHGDGSNLTGVIHSTETAIGDEVTIQKVGVTFSAMASSVTLQGNDYSIAGIAESTGTLTVISSTQGVMIDAIRESTGTLQADLATEVSDRQIAVAAVAVSTGLHEIAISTTGARVEAIAASTGTLTDNLATEVSDRTIADASIAVSTGVNTEAIAALVIQADAIAVSTGTLTIDLATEVSDRGIADAAIAVSTGVNADTIAALEIQADAIAVDTGTLTVNLATEVSDRAIADAAIAVSTGVNTDAISALETQADSIAVDTGTLTVNLASEVSDRAAADAAIAVSTGTNTDAIAALEVSSGATQTQLDLHTVATSTHGATAANTADRIVMRDGSGAFSAGDITAALLGNADTATTTTGNAGTASALAADPSDCTSPQFALGITADGSATCATVPITSTATIVTDLDAVILSTQPLALATAANTADTLVLRDGSGNFTAGTVTAALVGNATTATTATNLAVGAANEIPYQDGAGSTVFIAAPGANVVLIGNSGAPSWSNTPTLTATNITGLPAASVNAGSLGTEVIASSIAVDAVYTDALLGSIPDTKLATIATALKVSNSATTATDANTASAIVARDGSGNFSAGNITAALIGNATTASGVAWTSITVKPGWMQTTNLVATLADADTPAVSGFYQAGTGTNYPTTGTWYNLINVRKSTTGDVHGFQLTMSYYGEALWSRSYYGAGGIFSPWARILQDFDVSSSSTTTIGNPRGLIVNYGIEAATVTVTDGFFGDLTGNAATATTATNLAGDITNSTITFLAAISSPKFYGDGSSITGVPGDNLGNHTATVNLNMSDFKIVHLSTLTINDEDPTGYTLWLSSGINMPNGTIDANIVNASSMTVDAGIYGDVTGSLTGNATTATTSTNLSGGAAGSISYQSAVNTTAMLPIGTAGYVMRVSASNLAEWANTLALSGSSFSVGGSKLVVKAGNVGIGTASPGDKLQVAGSVTVDSTMTVTGNAFSVGGSTLVVKEGGVTIGDGSAKHGLTVNGGISTMFFDGQFNGGSRATLEVDAAAQGILKLMNNPGDDTVQLHTNGVSFLNGGNVGIGITNPANALEVDGNILSSGTVTGTNFIGSGVGLTGLPSGGGGDAVLAATQTWTGQNTFNNQVTVSTGMAVSGQVDLSGPFFVIGTSSFTSTTSTHTFSGWVDIGLTYTTWSGTCNPGATPRKLSCAAGYKVTGGGCYAVPSMPTSGSYPAADLSGWYCSFANNGACSIYAICARVK